MILDSAAVTDGVRAETLVYVGHATLLVELAGARLLTDPLLGAGIGHVRRRVPRPRLEELAGLDAVLISHAHRDHLDTASLRKIARDCPVIAPRGCARLLRRCGVKDFVAVQRGDRVAVGDVVVEAVHARHDGRRHPCGSPAEALGYVLQGATSVYFAGDTDLFDEMATLAGSTDVAALPISGWGARLPPGHLDPERAAQAVALIRPDVAVPIHWGTLRAIGTQRGLDAAAPTRAFVAAVARRAPGTAVRVLAPGQRMALAPRSPPPRNFVRRISAAVTARRA
jgi:L-ascorbate metabolism protein UlaG (beta-lactamase superfamily)